MLSSEVELKEFEDKLRVVIEESKREDTGHVATPERESRIKQLKKQIRA